MNEYLMDIDKNQTICVSTLHNACRCHRCKKARVKSGTPGDVTHKEPEPATVLESGRGV